MYSILSDAVQHLFTSLSRVSLLYIFFCIVYIEIKMFRSATLILYNWKDCRQDLRSVNEVDTSEFGMERVDG